MVPVSPPCSELPGLSRFAFGGGTTLTGGVPMTQLDPGPDLATAPPLTSATVAEAFQRRVAQTPDRIAIRTRGGAISHTWAEFGQRIRDVAAGLDALGLRHGETLALLIPNTIELHLLDYAALHLGAVPFAIFNSSSIEQIEYQLRQSDAEIIATERAQLPRVRAAVAAITERTIDIVLVDGEAEGCMPLARLESSGSAEFDFDATWRAIRPDDLATLIFTSGTTGPPKAAQWSHAGIMAGQRALDAAIPVTKVSVVSFLPMAHAGGRATTHYMAMSYGTTITVCPEMSQAVAHFIDARPDAILSVPRVFEKLQVAVEGMIEAIEDPAERDRAKATVELGRRIARARDAASTESIGGEDLSRQQQEHAAGVATLAPVLARLGLDRLQSAIVGGAPAAPELGQFYRAIGVPFIEAYGSTEASLAIFNRVEDYKSGTAGRPLPGVEVRLLEDGELLVRSPFNFVDYRKQPEETAAALDADGWLHTGDTARIDDQGYVTIVDRKKEIMISSSGKNMSPINIEAAVKGESSLIAQVVSIGDRRHYVTALIVLDPDAVATMAAGLDKPTTDFSALVHDPDILADVAAAVARGNQRLSRSEQIKKYLVLRTTWVPGSDELTPTGKMRRKPIAQKYATEIDSLYAE